jgi:hypothetical protein
MKDTKKIMYESDEAAQLKTVTGWVSSDGRFFGKDEHLARYAGSTHALCECGQEKDRGYTICETCRNKANYDKFISLPFKDYDGSPVYSNAYDKFFFESDEIEEFLEENELESIDLLFCDSVPYSPIGYDYWDGDLPEDFEIPKELETRVTDFNKFLETLPPASWVPGKIRTCFAKSL